MIGGQSNSRGTNTEPTNLVWNTTDYIQSFCWMSQGCDANKFVPAQVPLFNENNVGFSQTYANLLLQTLPENHGVILINTGVGGTGFFETGDWTAPNGKLVQQSVQAMQDLQTTFTKTLGGNISFHSMLWHQGEHDAGDNFGFWSADYCTYLMTDLSNLIDYLRGTFQGASAGTPFLDGGLLPYWVDQVNGTNGTAGVMDAIYGLNTSRVCTATADSRIFTDFLPDGVTPNGDPNARSGVSHDVIHFNSTQAVLMGYQYWAAYQNAVKLTTTVPSARTQACGGSSLTVDQCVSSL